MEYLHLMEWVHESPTRGVGERIDATPRYPPDLVG